MRQPQPPPPLQLQAILEFPPDTPGRVRITLPGFFSFTTEHSARMYTVLDQHLARQSPPLMLRSGFHLRSTPDGTVLAAEVSEAPVRSPKARPLTYSSPAAPKAGPWH